MWAMQLPPTRQIEMHGSSRSNISRRAYITRGAADCNTKRVVYMIQCRRCGRQYVSQTGQSLKDRIKNHLRKIRDHREVNTLHEHFRKGACRGVHNMMVQVLHVLKDVNNLSSEQTEAELKRMELLWMDRLMSEYPQGLNHTRNDVRTRHIYYK